MRTTHVRNSRNEAMNKNLLKGHWVRTFAKKAFKHNHRVIFYPFIFIICHYVTILLDIYHNVWVLCG